MLMHIFPRTMSMRRSPSVFLAGIAWCGLLCCVACGSGGGPGLTDATIVDDGQPPDGALVDDLATKPDAIPPSECWGCASDEDCTGDAKCVVIGGSKTCLTSCVDDGDCPRSFICYAATTAGKICLPVSFSCAACIVDNSCQAGGKVCDFVSATCKTGNPTCGRCTYDFDCEQDLRCYRATGAATGRCVPECSGATPCADSSTFACGTTERGVHLCIPKDPGRCAEGCSPGAPFPSPDGTACYECLNNSHCTEPGEYCNINVTHTCVREGDCIGQMQCSDGMCHECCEDSDCLGGSGPCMDYQCQNRIDACDGQCTGTSFPVCKIINSVPQCVQCETDAQCADMDPSCTCTGDPTYTCLASNGNVCCPCGCPAICSTDADCPPDANGASLLCSSTVNGFCYNPTGACDGVTSCCGAGQSCFDILSELSSGMGGIPGGVLPGTGGYCTCNDAHPCLGGGACTSTDAVCSIPVVSDTLCPGGVKAATLPDKICADLGTILGGLFGGVSLP
jgi:hypothetical protein